MIKRFLTDKQVEKRYVEAGCIFGDAVSYIYLGECVGFDGLLNKWAKWEVEYAKRGYRAISVDDFINYGGYGTPLQGIGVRRAEGEDPVFHAEIYRAEYLGKIQPAVNLQEFLRPIEPRGDKTEPPVPRVHIGTFLMPSTKKAE